MSRRAWVLLLPDNGRLVPVLKGSLCEMRDIAGAFGSAAEVRSVQWAKMKGIRP